MLSTEAVTEAQNTVAPGLDPDDHVIFVVDEDVCTRCGLCVDRCPTGVIIMGKAGVAGRDGDHHQRDFKHGYSYGMRW
jgi:NAD-dependent dihydropyrimidine dehydrogenase PreA subunit